MTLDSPNIDIQNGWPHQRAPKKKNSPRAQGQPYRSLGLVLGQIHAATCYGDQGFCCKNWYLLWGSSGNFLFGWLEILETLYGG